MLLLSIGETFASIGIWIVSGIYKVAAVAFEIFLVLADGTLLSSIDFDTIIKNFYVIIGIVMLFILAFALLKGIVNPDDQKQGTQVVKKVIINLITSAIIMAVLPSIFTFAYDFQKSFIYDNNPIGKFFGYGSLDGSVSNTGGNDSIKKGAYQIVNGVYTAFFNVSTSYCDDMGWSDIKECQDNVEGDSNLTFSDAMLDVEATGDFNLYGNFSKNVDKNEIDFSFLLSLIGGALVIYVAVSFCFDMAVRLVKLAFYQIIAPIPIFCRIIPEGKLSGTFKQWVKITLTCYMEVYTRIFAFYFCVYLCQEMLGAPFFDNLISRGFLVRNLSKAFVLMGIITFMKQAPKLISEVTGIDSGNMKLGIKDKLAAGGAFTAGAVLGGGATSLVRNAANKWGNKNNWKNKDGKVTAGSVARNLGAGLLSAGAGGISGSVRSGKAGWNAKSFGDMKTSTSKGITGSTNARDKRANYKAAHGGTIRGAALGHIKDFGIATGRYITDTSIEGLTRESQSMSKIASKYNTFSDNIENLLEKEQSKGHGSVFKDHGFKLKEYNAFNRAADGQKSARAAFNGGYAVDYDYIDKDGNHQIGHGEITAAMLTDIEGHYIKKRDAARDELMNMSFEGSKGVAYKALDAKGQAALKDSLVNAESLQATILENANTSVIQGIMGENGGLRKVIANDSKNPLTVSDFEIKDANGKTIKVKDAAKVAQGQADIKIAEMNKEQAAKGDKK